MALAIGADRSGMWVELKLSKGLAGLGFRVQAGLSCICLAKGGDETALWADVVPQREAAPLGPVRSGAASLRCGLGTNWLPRS